MDRIVTTEQMRTVFITGISPVMGMVTPTAGFVYALVTMFAFNIWAGMRADGVSIVRCRNFSFRKFKNALVELVLYLFIMELVFTTMTNCGDSEAAIVVVKSLTYVFMYVYLQNAFRNLIRAYPKKMALRVIYHIIRFEFTRALPSYLQPLMERLDREYGEDMDNINKEKNEDKD